jgi:hypothetical protein
MGGATSECRALMIVARSALFEPVRSAWLVCRDENRPTIAASADQSINTQVSADSFVT